MPPSYSLAAAQQDKASIGSLEIAGGPNSNGGNSSNGGSNVGKGCCGCKTPAPTPAEAWRSLKVFGRMLVSKYLNVLLLAAPFGILARVLEWGPGPVFFLNFV